jgi:hypothetical protein
MRTHREEERSDCCHVRDALNERAASRSHRQGAWNGGWSSDSWERGKGREKGQGSREDASGSEGDRRKNKVGLRRKHGYEGMGKRESELGISQKMRQIESCLSVDKALHKSYKRKAQAKQNEGLRKCTMPNHCPRKPT